MGGASREYQTLLEEEARLRAEFERLRGQRLFPEGGEAPFDRGAHKVLIAALRAHREKIVAWRRRYLPDAVAPDAAP